MNHSNVEALENQLKDAKELAERARMATRLASNRDFRKLILDDFCVQECARLVGLSADPSLPKEQRDDALAMAQAAGHLRRYLSAITRMGAIQSNEIPAIEAAIEEARAFEDAEGSEG